MKSSLVLAVLTLILLGSLPQSASADVKVYVGYLNNLGGAPAPGDIPTPFDADASTILISSGGSATDHDTGVIRFLNDCDQSVTINVGLNVKTSGGFFQIWDGSLSLVLAPGMNLVLAETVNFNFDSSDFGLGSNPIVSGSINGMAFSFEDVDRVLLGHEEGGGFGGPAETTPYHLIGAVACPEADTLTLFAGLGVLGLGGMLRRRR